MKHFITTTELLENVLEENSTEDIENLHVFAKKTDTISMTIYPLLMDIVKNGGDTQFIMCDSPDEIPFRLGMMLSEQEEYVISESVTAIPGFMMDKFNIIVGKGKVKRGKAGKTGKMADVSKKKKEATIPTEKKASKENFETNQNTSEKIQKQVSVPPEPSEERPVSVGNQNIVSEQLVDESIPSDYEFSQGYIPDETENYTYAEQPTPCMDEQAAYGGNFSYMQPSAEDFGISEQTAFPQEIVEQPMPEQVNNGNPNLSYFVKQIGVRANDLQDYNGDETTLALALMDIFAMCENKNDVEVALATTFGSENAEIILKWTAPNIKKLHELAML